MNNKKVEIKINNEAGDSAQHYGEQFDDRFGTDPITKKKVAAPFHETHGKRIMESLFDVVENEKPDDPEQIEKDYQEMVSENQKFDSLHPERGQSVNNNDIMGLNQESQSNDSQVHAVNEFSKQESNYNQQIQKEVAEYKDNFNKLSEKIAEQEKILSEITEKFNNCKDKDEKIKLFTDVNEEMGKLVAISYNYGNAVEKSDVSSVIDGLSSYDEGYDESATRKYIKEL